MTYQLALRMLGLLAIVAVCTAVLVAPEPFTGRANVNAPALVSMLALGHA